MTFTDHPVCLVCEKELNPKRCVEFEMNCVTLDLWEVGTEPRPDWSDGPDSQGVFDVGLDCAKQCRSLGNLGQVHAAKSKPTKFAEAKRVRCETCYQVQWADPHEEQPRCINCDCTLS